MAIGAKSMTLEEFVRWRRINRRPYLEYIAGEVIAKAVPLAKHGFLQSDLAFAIDQYAHPRGLGRALIEMRYTVAGWSIQPDVSFVLKEHFVYDKKGDVADVIPTPPDLHVEITSPDELMDTTRRKLAHSTTNGCPLGVLVHTYHDRIEVYRDGLAEMLPPDGTIDFAPVLPGFRIGVAEVFDWLRNPVPRCENPTE